MSKLMMLVAAKWRLFSESNPHMGGGSIGGGGGSEENTNNSVLSEYTPKSTRPRNKESNQSKVRCKSFYKINGL